MPQEFLIKLWKVNTTVSPYNKNIITNQMALEKVLLNITSGLL